jgi:hypothetical protein
MKDKPLFSICHTSARPDKWRAVYDDWMSKAVHPQEVEYVLVIDPRWNFSLDPAEYELPSLVVMQNTGRSCYVDGVNIAAKASSGSILIVNADDQFACEGWDQELIMALRGRWRNAAHDPFVIDVNVGTPVESAHKVCQMPILSRKRYEDQGGNVFFPEYESMCADNDFREWAVQDGVLIDAYHLPVFPHKHPMYSENGKWQAPDPYKWDQAYAVQNRQEATNLGLAILARRRAAKFSTLKRCIAFCYPGERFEGEMHDALMNLYAHLIERDFEVLRMRLFDNIVYLMRDEMRREIMRQARKPDLILMVDDDNPVTPAQFDQLLQDIDAHPEVDGVSAWCWIHDKEKKMFQVSCGLWAPDHLQWNPFPSSFVREQELKEIECGGLPCILMRLSALEKAGDDAFMPILDRRLEHGLAGEDMGFFRRAEEGGAKFLVDPKVRVRHLKYVSVEPVFPEDGAPQPVKVACMMRVKNEARWIRRTIDSVRELCGDHIYVMEDGSVDDTRRVAEECGAIVLPSPFVGLELNEARDKNWLYRKVMEDCSPDWILMPDGDEELEAEGCKKIKAVLELNPPVDCFALRFIYLWDSVDTARFDGVYGKMARQSLFRANEKFQFRSYYSEDQTANQNHVGLGFGGFHTSNAPGLGGRIAPLNVVLFHYGYLHREDRIRKYRWITTLDPHNEREGFYLHCVQGDLPEVPADAQLMHGGPLELRKLPAHLVPKFKNVPGPWSPDTARQEDEAMLLAEQ